MNKNTIVTLALICIIAVFPLLHLIPSSVAADTAISVDTKTFGYTEAEQPELIRFEDRANSFFFDLGSYHIEFFKDTLGYDKLYDKDGSVIVYNERLTLQHYDKGNWKQNGVPIRVECVKNGESYRVTRYYDNYIGTTWKAIYDIQSEQPVKLTFELNAGQTSEYRLLWSLSGITLATSETVGDKITYSSLEAENFIVDWSDVKQSYGDITTSMLRNVAEGKKQELTFNIGTVVSGQKYVLDPIFGYYTKGVTLDYIHNRILGSVATLPEDGFVYNMTCTLLKGTVNWGDFQGRMAIYRGTELVAVTIERRNVQAMYGYWDYTFSFASPVWLTSGDYILALWAEVTDGDPYDVGLAISNNSVADAGRKQDIEYYGAFPNPSSFTNNTYQYTIYATYLPDTTAPTINSVSANTTLAGNPVQLTANITDNAQVSGFIFEWNNTGVATNTTWASGSNATLEGTWNSTVDDVISVKVYANDTSNNWAASDTYNFTLTEYRAYFTYLPATLDPGDFADITLHIERGGEAYTSYLANITKNGELWKVNVSPSNATISEASLTDASNTYNVSAFYDTVSGENVNFDFQPITITWGTHGEGASGPFIQPPTETAFPIPTPEVPPENLQFGILVIVGILLASYGLYSVDKKSKSKTWSKNKDIKSGEKWKKKKK